MLGLVLPFYGDAGVISINEHLFALVDSRNLDHDAEDDDVPIGDAVAILRFLFQILDLGAGDAVVPGASIQDLIRANFPSLFQSLTDPEFGVPPPQDSQLDYVRFNQNFRCLNVSFYVLTKLIFTQGNTI